LIFFFFLEFAEFKNIAKNKIYNLEMIIEVI